MGRNDSKLPTIGTVMGLSDEEAITLDVVCEPIFLLLMDG